MRFQSERHKRTFERNMAKGFLVGAHTRVWQLLDSKNLYRTELENLRRIEYDLHQSIKNWRKFPPGIEEKEEKDGKTED